MSDSLPLRAGIRVKLTLIVLLVGLLPVGFLGRQALNEQRLVIMEEVKRSHNELSNILAHGIYENLEYIRRLMTAISELEVVRSLDPGITNDFFAALLKNFSFFKTLYLVDNQRRIVATTDPNIVLPPDWSFTNAMKRSYQGSLSEVQKTPDGMAYMTLEIVIRTPEKGVIGVLVARFDLAYVKDLLRNSLKRSKSQGLVLDEAGTEIAKSATDVEPIGISSSEVLDGDINGVRDVNGRPFMMTALSLKKFDFYQAPNWTIVLQIPESEAFSAVSKLRTAIFSLVGITAFIALILAVLISNSFIRPLLHLIEGARTIGAGNFDYAIEPRSNDEIGELTQTFDEMRANLKATKADLDYRIIQLETLYEVGKAISSILDFNHLQHLILETVTKVLKAEKGSLMLLDEAEKVLTIGVAIGLADDVKRETKINPGENVSGWVLEKGEPFFVEDVESDHAFLALKKTNITRGTLMSVPLKAKEKVLGVINVSRSVPGSFKEKDFELFKSLANQAAIAIENARLYRYAVTDEMTRLYNHRFFQQRLDEELQRAERYDNVVSLLILDVDHFKKFNDTYGHPEGDRVLKTVSRLIEKSIREVDIPARYGGEEFVVICPEKDGEGSMVPAQRIRSTIESYDFRINGQHVPITVSLGVATFPTHARNKTELVMHADTALYYSKENGRNQASLYHANMKSDEVERKRKAKEDAKKKPAA